jgi:hypothetical protein
MPVVFLRGRHVPDAVQRALQFGEHRGRADHQHHEADGRGQQALGRFVRAFDQRLYAQGAVAAYQAGELAHDLALHGFAAPDKTGHGDHDQQQRRDGKHRVVGNRGTHAGGVVAQPGRDRLFPKLIKVFEVHLAALPCCRWGPWTLKPRRHEYCQGLARGAVGPKSGWL